MTVTRDPFKVSVPAASKAPALVVALSLATGMLVGFAFNTLVSLAVFTVIGIVAIIARAKGLVLLAITAVIGVIDVAIQQAQLPNNLKYETEQQYSGAVVGVNEKDDAIGLIVELDSIDGIPVKRTKIAVTLMHDSVFSSQPSAGYEISFKGTASRPGATLLLPDERDFDRENRRRGIVASVLSSDSRTTNKGSAPGIMNCFRRWRDDVVDAIRYADFSTATTAFVVACMAGDDTLIAPTDRDKIATAGLAHLLALSGTHVAILTLLIGFILLPVRLLGKRHLTSWLTIGFLWLFAFVTGLSPSVVRAVTMASVLLTARIIERSVSPFQSLSVAAILILIFNPYALFAIGFQISFAAVWGIISVGQLLQRSGYPKYPFYLRLPLGFLLMTIAATIATAPLVAYYFHLFPIWFIPANMIATIVLPLILASAIPCIVFTAVTSNRLFPEVTDFLYGIIESVSQHIAAANIASIDMIYPPVWAVVAFYTVMVSGTVWTAISIRRQLPIAVSTLLSAFCLTVCFMHRPSTPASEWHLHGVFTGTAILVTENNTAWLVTDCQTKIEENMLAQRLTPRLRNFLGRRKIDSLQIMPQRYTSPLIDRRNGWINIGGTSFVFINNEQMHPAEKAHVDYLLITKGVRNDADSIVAAFNPAKVVLTASLNAKISRRLQLDLQQNGIKSISLRDTIVHSSNAPFESSSR